MSTADTLEIMSAEEMVALTKQHSFFSWSAQDAVNPIPMARAKASISGMPTANAILT